jgi:hypothetical protein
LVLWQRAANFLCMRSSSLDSVIVTECQATEAYSSFDLIRAKHSISRLSVLEKEDIIFTACLLLLHFF